VIVYDIVYDKSIIVPEKPDVYLCCVLLVVGSIRPALTRGERDQSKLDFRFQGLESCLGEYPCRGDKDFNKKGVLAEAFPDARQILCQFHVIDYLRKQVLSLWWHVERWGVC
jgi:hypothetical protein